MISDVTKFETFNDFFTRRLKPNARIVDPTSTLVSVLYFFMRYHKYFFDPPTSEIVPVNSPSSDRASGQCFLKNRLLWDLSETWHEIRGQ